MDTIKTERVYIRISDIEKEQFKQASNKLDCSLSEFIREACREKIEREFNNNARN